MGKWTEELEAFVGAYALQESDEELARMLSFMAGEEFTTEAVRLKRSQMGLRQPRNFRDAQEARWKGHVKRGRNADDHVKLVRPSLRAEDAPEIRRLYDEEGWPMQKIAEHYGLKLGLSIRPIIDNERFHDPGYTPGPRLRNRK